MDKEGKQNMKLDSRMVSAENATAVFFFVKGYSLLFSNSGLLLLLWMN